MSNCKECHVSIVSGNYCHLCAKAMISNNNVSMEATSMKKSLKSKLVISDLSSASKSLYFKDSIFSSICYEQEIETLYGSDETLDVMENEEEKEFKDNELTLLGVHTGEFLSAQEKPLTDLDKAKAIVKAEGYNVDELSSELVLEMAKHFLDSQATESDTVKYPYESRVSVKIQRMSNKGFWYNVKEKLTKEQKDAGVEAEVIWFSFDLEDLFVLDDSNNIEDLRYINGKPALYKYMQDRGYKTYYLQPVKDEETGAWDYETREQRFLVSSTAFNEFTTISGSKFDDFSAAFNYKVVNGEVVEQRSTWSYDNMIELDAMAFMAIQGIDNTSAHVDNRVYQQGIITGTSVATKKMMYDDMKKSDAETLAAEEKAEKRSLKAVVVGKLKSEFKHNGLLSHASAPYVISLIEKSLTLEGAYEFDELCNELEQNIENLSLFLSIAREYRKETGKQFAYDVFTKIQTMMKRNSTIKVKRIENDKDYIIENIKYLNKGQITIHQPDFDDEIALEIYKAATEHGLTNSNFFIRRDVFLALNRKVIAINKSAKSA